MAQRLSHFDVDDRIPNYISFEEFQEDGTSLYKLEDSIAVDHLNDQVHLFSTIRETKMRVGRWTVLDSVILSDYGKPAGKNHIQFNNEYELYLNNWLHFEPLGLKDSLKNHPMVGSQMADWINLELVYTDDGRLKSAFASSDGDSLLTLEFSYYPQLKIVQSFYEKYNDYKPVVKFFYNEKFDLKRSEAYNEMGDGKTIITMTEFDKKGRRSQDKTWENGELIWESNYIYTKTRITIDRIRKGKLATQQIFKY